MRSRTRPAMVVLAILTSIAGCGRDYESKRIGCNLSICGGMDCDNGTGTLSICAPIEYSLDATGSSATTRQEDGTFIETYGATPHQGPMTNCIDFQAPGGGTDIPVPEDAAEIFMRVRKKTGPSADWKNVYATVKVS